MGAAQYYKQSNIKIGYQLISSKHYKSSPDLQVLKFLSSGFKINVQLLFFVKSHLDCSVVIISYRAMKTVRHSNYEINLLIWQQKLDGCQTAIKNLFYSTKIACLAVIQLLRYVVTYFTVIQLLRSCLLKKQFFIFVIQSVRAEEDIVIFFFTLNRLLYVIKDCMNSGRALL